MASSDFAGNQQVVVFIVVVEVILMVVFAGLLKESNLNKKIMKHNSSYYNGVTA
jgi:hypothetical protein